MLSVISGAFPPKFGNIQIAKSSISAEDPSVNPVLVFAVAGGGQRRAAGCGLNRETGLTLLIFGERRAHMHTAGCWMQKTRPAAPLNASRDRKAAQTHRHTVNERAFSTNEQLMQRSVRASVESAFR